MSAPENSKPSGASSTDFFEPIGQKAEQVAPSTANGVATENDVGGADDQKVVEEIESLCMNCGQNVCHFLSHSIPWQRE
jgi:zinc finger protein